MRAAWRHLQENDRIRIVRMPSGSDAPGSLFSACTRRLYEKLIARRRAVRVYEIDEWGLPWIRCKFRRRNGSWEHHFLAVNDDSWVHAKRRTDWADSQSS
jgi:hypothetical protein